MDIFDDGIPFSRSECAGSEAVPFEAEGAEFVLQIVQVS